MTRVGLVGVGRWGRRLLRGLSELAVVGREVTLVAAADPDRAARDFAREAGCEAVFEDVEALLAGRAVDAVVIASPPGLHYAHARVALEAGKHVLVEKPLATSLADARELVALAQARERTLMVGHICLFAASIRWVKRYLDDGQAGELRYAFFQRVNTGRVRRTVDAMWNLAPHDLAISDFWFGEAPERVHAVGRSVVSAGRDDASLIRLQYPSGGAACILVSCLSGVHARRAAIVTDRCVIECDELAEAPIVVHRDGESFSPELDQHEPLRAELEHFVDCVGGRGEPLTNGRGALSVVASLEAADRSKREGAPISLVGGF